jgi:hypothetical protein
LSERYADDEIPSVLLNSAGVRMRRSRCPDAFAAELRAAFQTDGWLNTAWEQFVLESARIRPRASMASRIRVLKDLVSPGDPAVGDSYWRTSTAVALATQMYDSRDFSAMPILADALQDAGCDNTDILDHCRGPGPHVRGCWVVDLVLGKG